MRSPLDRALEGFPAPLARGLRELATTPGACAVISAHEAAAWGSALGVDVPQLMLRLVGWAACRADVPISGFRVGAVARGLSGALYAGANLEFAGLPLSCSVHAEQSALTNAWVHGEEGLDAVAVSAAPCGYCRQFLYELVGAERLEILLPERPATRLSALLPAAFGPRDLDVAGGLMQPQRHDLVLAPSGGDEARSGPGASADAATLDAALRAADASVRAVRQDVCRGGAAHRGRRALRRPLRRKRRVQSEHVAPASGAGPPHAVRARLRRHQGRRAGRVRRADQPATRRAPTCWPPSHRCGWRTRAPRRATEPALASAAE